MNSSSTFVLADQPGLAAIVLGSLIVIYFAVRYRRRSREKNKTSASKLPPMNHEKPWL